MPIRRCRIERENSSGSLVVDTAFTAVARWADGVWTLLLASALWFLIGLVLAGLLWHWLRGRSLARRMAGNDFGGVVRAALIGIPLPLCSCSVLPVASQLRSSGASRGATAAFLVSTPETGVDSIALTYTLTDPILTVARPATAFVTAVVAGSIETLFFDRTEPDELIDKPCEQSCCGQEVDVPDERRGIAQSIKYAFTDLMGDLAPYLLFGYLLAGLVGALFGQQLTEIPEILRSGWGGYAGAVIAGLPLYICASSSTPLAAVLLAGGFSPGMVLVFMMTGAATNLSTIAVVRKILGSAGTMRYLLAIAVVSIGFGLITDQVYQLLEIDPSYQFAAGEEASSWYDVAAAVLLGVMMAYWTVRATTRRLASFFLK